MFNDPYWGRFEFKTDYPFGVLVFNVTTLVAGFHPSEFKSKSDDPYRFRATEGMKVESLDDYLVVLDRSVSESQGGRGGLPQDDARLPAHPALRERSQGPCRQSVRAPAQRALRRRRSRTSKTSSCGGWSSLSARYELPFQIHTGHGRIQGSNPMNLVDLIEANPRTKFILFHGGFPWVGETGIILMRHRRTSGSTRSGCRP